MVFAKSLRGEGSVDVGEGGVEMPSERLAHSLPYLVEVVASDMVERHDVFGWDLFDHTRLEDSEVGAGGTSPEFVLDPPKDAPAEPGAKWAFATLVAIEAP